MKVGILTTSFPLWAGHGSGQFVFHLARALAEAGVAIEVLAPHAPGAKAREDLDGVLVRRCRYFWPSTGQVLAYGGGIAANLRHRPLARAQVPLLSLALLWHGWALASRVDLLHAQWTFAGALGVLLSSSRRRPLVVTLYGSDLNLAGESRVLRGLAAFSLARAQRLIAVSEALRQQALSLGAEPGKLEVIPLGVEPREFASDGACRAGESDEVLFVGRLAPEKGPGYLLRAMSRVVACHPGARLSLVGEGPLRAELEEEVARLGLGEHVCFLGSLPHWEVVARMLRAGVVVLPSLNEGLPTVLAEAMMAGRPVVASRVGGVPDIVAEGENGWLVPPKDVASLAEGLVALLGDPQARDRMGEAGRERVLCGFTWESIARRTLAVYEAALAAKEA